MPTTNYSSIDYSGLQLDDDVMYTTALKIMDTVRSEFSSRGLILPDRQYVTVGEIGNSVHDCEQVTVSFGTVAEGLPQNRVPSFQRCTEPVHSIYAVEIVRCVPVPKTSTGGRKGSPPEASELEAYAKLRMIDSVVLWEVGKTIGAEALGQKAITNHMVSEASDLQGVGVVLNMVPLYDR